MSWTTMTTVSCPAGRSEEHTSELQSRRDLVCRLLLEKKNNRRLIDVDSAIEDIFSAQPHALRPREAVQHRLHGCQQDLNDQARLSIAEPGVHPLSVTQ